MTSITARAAVLQAFNAPFEIRTVNIQAPRPDEVRVRLVATGICHTDLVVAAGHTRAPLPVVLGHEGAGVVESVGSAVTTHRPGDHVVLSFAHCGHCPACHDHAPSYCAEFMPRNFACARPDGSSSVEADPSVRSHFFGQSSFASYAVCSASNAIVVSKDAPLELLGPLGCGIQTGAGAVMNAMKVAEGSSIAVFGAGAVGLSAVMAARVVGARTIIAVDRNPERLELAKELGATEVILVADEDGAQQIQQRMSTRPLYTLDTTGVPAVVEAAIAVLAPRGVCAVVAGSPDKKAALPINFMFAGGRTVRGVMEGDSVPQDFIPQLVELYQQGRFPFDKLVQFFSLDEINSAMSKAASGEVVKPIVRF